MPRRPLSPPPSRQLRPFFLRPGRLSLPVSTLTRGIQGCPKTISLDKNTWHPTFENLSNPPFFCRFALVHFCNTFCQKMLSFLHHSTIRESFRIFLSSQLFSLLPNECQLFMPKDFLEPPCLTLPGEPLVLQERVEGGGKQITSPLPQIYCPLSPNS